MGLESGSTISALNENWPLGSDPKSQGDDHFRLVKRVIKNDVVPKSGGKFTGTTGAGTFALDGSTTGVNVAPSGSVQGSSASSIWSLGAGASGAGLYGQLSISMLADVPGLMVRGAASQSQPLATFRDGADVLMASVLDDGTMDWNSAVWNGGKNATAVSINGAPGLTYPRIAVNCPSAQGGSAILRWWLGSVETIRMRGNGEIANASGSIVAVSDPAAKTDIAPATDKLADVMRLEVINYALADLPDLGKLIGFNADNVAEVFPALVSDDPEGGPRGVKWSVLVPILVKALQELVARVEALEADVSA